MSCFMAKSVIWHNFQSSSNKQARQTFHWFVLNSHFNKPSECKYVHFAFLSFRMQVSFIPLRSDTLAGDFLSDLSKEIRAVPPTLWFSRIRIEITFRGHCRLRKLKSVKINPYVFETKLRKFGDAKISHYTVNKALSCLTELNAQGSLIHVSQFSKQVGRNTLGYSCLVTFCKQYWLNYTVCPNSYSFWKPHSGFKTRNFNKQL